MVSRAVIACLVFLVLVVAICNQGNPLLPGNSSRAPTTLVTKAAYTSSGLGPGTKQTLHHSDRDQVSPRKVSTTTSAAAAPPPPPPPPRTEAPSPSPSPDLAAAPRTRAATTGSPPGSPSEAPAAAVAPAAANAPAESDDDGGGDQPSLSSVLESAAMENITPAVRDGKTVLVAELNQAWATGGLFDLFLRSFREGEGTVHLLDHLVVAALDKEALRVCRSKRLHCFRVQTPGLDLSAENKFMTPNYLETNKAKVEFLTEVLRLGFNLVYILQDCDTLWLRSPFQHFSRVSDLDVSCNHDFTGNSSDTANHINTGILHVRSNNRTVKLFELWAEQQLAYPDKNDQDVFEIMKESPDFEALGLTMRYIPTEYMSGYCRMNADFEKVCTMHAICCIGQDVKLSALQQSLEDWTASRALTPQEIREMDLRFTLPECSM